MKRIFIILLLLIAFKGTCQSTYDKGYQDGYSNGYCYDKGTGCLLPIPTIPPIPKINEDPNSYQDGYNRGFAVGIAKQETNNSSSEYSTSTPQSVDFIYKLDYGSIIELSKMIYNIKAIAVSDIQKKDFHTSIYLLSKCLSISPYDDELYFYLGVSYFCLKDYKTALANLQKAKELDPNEPNIDKQIEIVNKSMRDNNQSNPSE